MREEDFDKKLMHLEEHVINAMYNNLNPVYTSIERLKSEIKTERADLENKLVKAEARLKIYETMFEKLNLNIDLDQRGGDEQ